MNKLTEVTRRDLIDIIKNGFVYTYYEPYHHPDYHEPLEREVTIEVKMPFCGRLSEIDFLSRLYDLDNMPSTDGRFKNASGDIWQHTVNNDDWEPYWFFSDRRFKLSNGSDEPLLNFISEMLHPAVRIENSEWKIYLEKFNEILSPDGYELFASAHISGREVFTAKEIDHIEIQHLSDKLYSSLKLIGEGSYAQVFKYKDPFYNKTYALKRAKKDLNSKELERFKREFEQMKNLNSPYIVEVYSFNEETNEYIMEFLDCTLSKFMEENNSTLTNQVRKSIISQLVNAYCYLHSKDLFHRDVSPKNVLIKKYEDVLVVKILDFGLVKIKESELTSDNTEFKGSLNDPALKTEGFKNYKLEHEIYALTLLIVYIITGKTNFGNIKDEDIRTFMQQGTNSDKSKRYKTLDELKEAAFRVIR